MLDSVALCKVVAVDEGVVAERRESLPAPLDGAAALLRCAQRHARGTEEDARRARLGVVVLTHAADEERWTPSSLFMLSLLVVVKVDRGDEDVLLVLDFDFELNFFSQLVCEAHAAHLRRGPNPMARAKTARRRN